MKKTALLLLLPIVLCCSCSNGKSDFDSNRISQQSNISKNAYSLFVNQEKNADFEKKNDEYILNNIFLKRGDIVNIRKTDGDYFDIEDYSDSSCFLKKQKYVEIFVEGKYQISIRNGKVSFTRVSSLYQSFALRLSDGTERRGTSVDEFSFEIEKASFVFRESFSLYLDEERVSASDIDIQGQEDCISVSEDGVVSFLQSGTFSFSYDARKEKRVSITSDDLVPPLSLIQDKDEYRSLLSGFALSDESIVSIESTSLVEDKQNKTTLEKEIRQNNYTNESSYSVSIVSSSDGSESSDSIMTRCISNDNYYCLEKNGDDVSLLDAKSLSESVRQYPSGYTCVPEEVISETEARKRISSFSPLFDSLSSYFSSLLVSKHLPSSSPMTEEETEKFESSFSVSSQYTGLSGCAQRIEATAYEKAKGSKNSSAVKDEVSFELSEEGTLISGTYRFTYYQDSPSLLLEDYSLSNDAKISRIESGTFDIIYGSRTESQALALDPEKYIASSSSLTFAEDLSVKAGGDLFDIQKYILAMDGSYINKGDFRVMAYDSQFFYPGVGNDKYLYTRDKGGKTKIYVGTKYQNDIVELVIDVKLNDATSILLKGQDGRTEFSNPSFEELSEYKMEASALSGQNPCFSVSSDHEDIVKVKECSSKDDALKEGKTSFTLSFLKEGSAVITVQSLSNPLLSKKVAITVTKPASLENYTGIYYSSSYGTLEISDDGSATYTKDGNTYTLKVSLVKDMLILSSSAEVASFEGSISIYNEKLSLSKLLVVMKTQDGKINLSGATFYQGFSLFESGTLRSGNATLTIKDYKVRYSTSKFHGELKEAGHTLEFDFNMDSSGSCYMDDSYILDGNPESYQLRISHFAVDSSSLSLTFSGSGYFADKSYTFDKQA